MANIFPFKALRAQPAYVERFSASAADSDVREEEGAPGKENPYSFLHVLNPQLYATKRLTSEEIFSIATEKLAELLNKNIIAQEEKPALYIYRQVKDNNVYTGIICLADIKEYQSDTIKKHELTHAEKESKITRYFQEVGANGNPVLLTYPDRPKLQVLIQELVEDAPEYGFMGEDGIEHSLWVISDENKVAEVQQEFAQVPDLYIADGHHRCAALSAMYPEVKHLMVCLIPASQLNIHGFHRYLKDISELSTEEFLQKIKDKGFDICDHDGHDIVNAPGTMHLHIDEKWYCLKIPQSFKNNSNPKQNLDVYILDKYIFCDILGIEDSRLSNKIKYVNGDVSMETLLSPIHKGFYKAAFTLSSVTVDEIIQVSDFGETMPPKSTWIEPKLRSGLVLHRFEMN